MPKDQSVNFEPSLREIAFEGRVWNVVRETFDYSGQTLVRDFIEHPGAVAVVAVNEANEILMIRQYRHPVRKFLWEIPAGLLDVAGESHLEAAKRELMEETFHQAEKWELLQTFHASPGGNSEQIDIFLATQVSPIETDYQREGEEIDMEVRWVAFEEALASVVASEIQSPIAVIAMLALSNRRK
jgi:8-oxo-dGTP pyrophosphatase MutT (NUDIX family)